MRAGSRSCCRTHGGTIASLQSATVVSLHSLTTLSCPVGVDILYKDYNARERYGAVWRGESSREDLQNCPVAAQRNIGYALHFALGLSPVQAATQLGLKRRDISKLMHGRFTGFSVDRLIALTALEIDVDIVLRLHSENDNHRGAVRVVATTA